MPVLDKPQVPAQATQSEMDDPLVPEAPGTVVGFYAVDESGNRKYVSNLRLVRQPETFTQSATGQKQRVLVPVRYEFGPSGHLGVTVGNDVLRDGEYDPATQQSEALDCVGWLRRHRDFNIRFFEEGHEPGRAQPPDDVILRETNRALVDRDVDTLVARLHQERGTHNRPLILETVQNALTLLEAPVPDPSESPAPVPAPARPETPEEMNARRAAELAGESRKGEGGVPLDSVEPYSGPSKGTVF